MTTKAPFKQAQASKPVEVIEEIKEEVKTSETPTEIKEEVSDINTDLNIANENSDAIGTTGTNILNTPPKEEKPKEQPILTNKELAVQRLISSVGLDVYNNSHLKSLIDKDGDIDEIEANWLAIGTKQYDETNPEQAEERFNEFKMYSGE